MKPAAKISWRELCPACKGYPDQPHNYDRTCFGADEEKSAASASPREFHLEAALEKIAAPRRPDGTYNLSREACEQIAREALGG